MDTSSPIANAMPAERLFRNLANFLSFRHAPRGTSRRGPHFAWSRPGQPDCETINAIGSHVKSQAAKKLLANRR
jgi:hypothetical protein